MFLFSAITALAVETVGLLAVIAWLHVRVRPREQAGGAWAAGLAALPVGAALFLCVLVIKGVIADLVPSLTHPPDPGWTPLLVHGLVAGAFVGVAEEVVRFGAAIALFRGARGKPVTTGALFALGWGGVEILLVVWRQVSTYVFLIKLFGGPSSVRMPFVPLLVPVERFGALTLHLALTGFAVAAAMALARGRAALALGLFAGATAIHALLDAWVRVMYVRHGSLVDAGDVRGIPGTLLLEAVFVTGAVVALVLAARLPAPTEATAPPAA